MVFLSYFYIRVRLISNNELQIAPFSKIYWNSLKRIAVLSFHLFFFSFIFISWRLITLQYYSGFCHTLTWIRHGLEFTFEAIWSWTVLKILNQPHYWQVTCSYSTSFQLSLGRLYISGNLSISSRLSILLLYSASYNLLWSFLFVWCCLQYLFFHFYFILGAISLLSW